MTAPAGTYTFLGDEAMAASGGNGGGGGSGGYDPEGAGGNAGNGGDGGDAFGGAIYSTGPVNLGGSANQYLGNVVTAGTGGQAPIGSSGYPGGSPGTPGVNGTASDADFDGGQSCSNSASDSASSEIHDAAAMASSSGTTCYQLTIKAWIPFAEVDDPTNTTGKGNYLNLEGIVPPCKIVKKESVARRTSLYSTFRGDTHQGFAGSYRVEAVIDFFLNGGQITGFSYSQDYGVTHRDITQVGPGGQSHACRQTRDF